MGWSQSGLRYATSRACTQGVQPITINFIYYLLGSYLFPFQQHSLHSLELRQLSLLLLQDSLQLLHFIRASLTRYFDFYHGESLQQAGTWAPFGALYQKHAMLAAFLRRRCV